MNWLDRLVEQWNSFVQTPRPGLEKAAASLRKTGKWFSMLWNYIYMLRGIILAAPVASAAAVLASKCAAELPDAVSVTLPGIDTQAENSVFGFLVYQTHYVARGTAVMASLVLTIACLLLMLCSKRVLYPWLISIFTLTVPLFLLLSNVYLA